MQLLGDGKPCERYQQPRIGGRLADFGLAAPR
jgi:hypothetical protein